MYKAFSIHFFFIIYQTENVKVHVQLDHLELAVDKLCSVKNRFGLHCDRWCSHMAAT